MSQIWLMGQNSFWHDDHETILKEWKNKAFVKLWLNEMSFYYYKKWSTFFIYTLIILTSTSSIILFLTNIRIANIIVALISMAIAILTGISLEIDADKKGHLFHAQYKEYGAIIREIDICLSMPLIMRQDPEAFLDNVNSKVENLGEQEMVVPARVIQKFHKNFGDLDKCLYGDEIYEIMKNHQQYEVEEIKIINKQEQEERETYPDINKFSCNN
jgi:hypothetical protein